jgi:hypothetical protein
MACVLAHGSMSAAPVPLAGQMAPNHALGLDPWEIRALVALVGGQTGTCAFPRPQTCPSVLLAKPGLILKPNLDWRTGRQVSYMRFKGAFEVSPIKPGTSF